MPSGGQLQLLGLALVGVVGGLLLFARGLGSWRAGARIGDLPGSPIGTAPAGEARLSGTIELDVATLTSPLQEHTCVYYRSTVDAGSGSERAAGLPVERAVSFWLHDPSGRIRVLPRGARWVVPALFETSDDLSGTGQGGLEPAELTVLGGVRQREATLEAGMTVTVVGSLLPYGAVADPASASSFDPEDGGPDLEVAADLAAAREAGRLATSPEAAWGNATIPGFGIGAPASAPTLDPGARPERLAPAGAAAQAAARFDIAPDTLVVAAAPEASLTIYAGAPAQVVAQERWTFGLGLVGGFLAAVAALVALLVLGGQL